MNGLIIGPGFQQWIDEHQGTPLSNELYFSEEMSCMMVQISIGGKDAHILLFYNKLTNIVIPFVEATL